MQAVTVVFIADADKLVPSAEDWPKVRHPTIFVMQPAAANAISCPLWLMIFFKPCSVRLQVWEEQKAWQRKQEAAQKPEEIQKVCDPRGAQICWHPLTLRRQRARAVACWSTDHTWFA